MAVSVYCMEKLKLKQVGFQLMESNDHFLAC